MAGDAAHITATSHHDDVPSIFDIIAEENMLECFQPAIEHLTKILAMKRPDLFGSIHHYSKEFYALIALLLENYYLKNYNSSLSENFYGLKRIPLSGNWIEIGLPKFIHFKSLFCLVGVPYLLSKLKEKYENNVHTNVKFNLYPILHFTNKFSSLVNIILFLTGKLKHHSPLLWLSGCKLSVLNEDDITMHNNSTLHYKDSGTFQKFIFSLGSFLSVVVQISLFTLQFLDWWYLKTDTSDVTTNVPKPPKPKCKQSETNICPVCKNNIIDPTCVAVSGYVFCYNCIIDVVKEREMCPVTKYKCTTEELFRIKI